MQPIAYRAIFVLLLAFSTMSLACNLRRGDDVLLPNGFRGWVVIRYKVAGYPSLEQHGSRNVIRVPPSGQFATSSTRETGYGADEYYYVDPNGKLKRLRNWYEDCPINETCVQQFQLFSTPSMATIFFVGGKDDISHYQKPPI